jgi:hypothetical protein
LGVCGWGWGWGTPEERVPARAAGASGVVAQPKQSAVRPPERSALSHQSPPVPCLAVHVQYVHHVHGLVARGLNGVMLRAREVVVRQRLLKRGDAYLQGERRGLQGQGQGQAQGQGRGAFQSTDVAKRRTAAALSDIGARGGTRTTGCKAGRASSGRRVGCVCGLASLPCAACPLPIAPPANRGQHGAPRPSRGARTSNFRPIAPSSSRRRGEPDASTMRAFDRPPTWRSSMVVAAAAYAAAAVAWPAGACLALWSRDAAAPHHACQVPWDGERADGKLQRERNLASKYCLL